MHDPDKESSPRDLRIASHARRDARQRRPAFSEELHGRIMDAVKEAGPATRAQSEIVPRPDDGTDFRTGPAITAVLVAAVALVVLSRFHFEQPAAPLAVAQLHTTQPADEAKIWPVMQTMQVAPARMQTAFASAVEEEQFAGLDEDARNMTRYLAKQVPFKNKWNKP